MPKIIVLEYSLKLPVGFIPLFMKYASTRDFNSLKKVLSSETKVSFCIFNSMLKEKNFELQNYGNFVREKQPISINICNEYLR